MYFEKLACMLSPLASIYVKHAKHEGLFSYELLPCGTFEETEMLPLVIHTLLEKHTTCYGAYFSEINKFGYF